MRVNDQVNEEVNQWKHLISPYKLWQFIDEGVFSLIDELDDQDEYATQQQQVPREVFERQLAVEKLDEKPFETVRLDTID